MDAIIYEALGLSQLSLKLHIEVPPPEPERVSVNFFKQ